MIVSEWMTLSCWLVAQLDKIQGVFWLNNGFLFSTEIWAEQLKKHPVQTHTNKYNYKWNGILQDISLTIKTNFAPRRHDEVEIFGTGGMILQNMKDLLQVSIYVGNEICRTQMLFLRWDGIMWLWELLIDNLKLSVPAWSGETRTDWPATDWHWW